jgi:hypothetical protein
MNDTQSFREYLEMEKLSPTTIKNHMNNVNKINKLLNDKSLIHQDYLVDILKNKEITLSQKLTMSSTISKYLKSKDLPNDNVVKYIADLNNEMKKNYKERNKKKEYQYTKKDILNATNEFYKKGNRRAYIVSYLVYTFSTRNTDLDVSLTTHQKYCPNKTDNYLILRKTSVLYIRNDYKTKSTYGQLKNEIKNKKFVESVRYLLRDTDLKCVKIFDSFKNSTKVLKRYLPFELKSSDIVKIVLNEKNSLNDASKISKNRGSALSTLQSNYNLKV